MPGFGAYPSRTVTFAGEAIPSLGHDEQLIAVFDIVSTARKNAALQSVPPVVISLLQGLFPCPSPYRTNHIHVQKGTVPKGRRAMAAHAPTSASAAFFIWQAVQPRLSFRAWRVCVSLFELPAFVACEGLKLVFRAKLWVRHATLNPHRQTASVAFWRRKASAIFARIGSCF